MGDGVMDPALRDAIIRSMIGSHALSGITVTYEEAAAAFDSTEGEPLPDIGGSMITSEQLAELKRLEQAATKGPWEVELNNPDHHPSYDDAWFIPQIWDHGHGSSEDAGIYERADAAFIAAARNLMPDLLAEVERLRAEIDALNHLLRIAADPFVPPRSAYSRWGFPGTAAQEDNHDNE